MFNPFAKKEVPSNIVDGQAILNKVESLRGELLSLQKEFTELKLKVYGQKIEDLRTVRQVIPWREKKAELERMSRKFHG